MDPELYNKIIAEYEQLKGTYFINDTRFVLKDLESKFCTEQNRHVVNEETIRSIVSYKYQQEQKEINRKVNWNAVFTDYQSGVGMLSIAASARISPALLSQRVINNLCSSISTQSQLKECQMNSNNIDNCYLAYESMLAHYSDPFYGIHYTQVSNNSGQVFEQQVEDYLRAAGVDFMNEEELRKKKYDVTPDFKLNIPVILERHWQPDGDGERKRCVHNLLITKPIEFVPLKAGLDSPALLSDEPNVTREVINWIECKSLFANEQCHREYAQNQYNSYVNRFGKGLVVYKFGCISTILEEVAKFVVLTQLPEVK